jgi:signal peptidase I
MLTTKTSQPKSNLWSLLRLVLAIIIPFIIVFGMRAYFIDNYYVPSGSMESTLMTGDRILVTLQGKEDVKRGDIIVFSDSQEWLSSEFIKNGFLVKRAVAIGGDTISANDKGQVLVNRQPIDEPYAQGYTAEFPEQLVPKGSVFVLGDNRENSADSRYHIGEGKQFIPVTDVKGKVWLDYFPFNTFRFVE